MPASPGHDALDDGEGDGSFSAQIPIRENSRGLQHAVGQQPIDVARLP